jgi:pimeloyl-ACP methyl ester carboxylesterase
MLLLLPDLNKTGALFAPLRAVLGSHQATVARYPFELSRYEALLKNLELPPDDFTVVAESFSGPLGIMLAARCARVRRLVLVATFARNPSLITSLGPLLGVLPTPPGVVLRAVLTGNIAVPDLERTISAVPQRTLVERVAAIRSVDVRAELRSLRVPVTLLRPECDRLIPTSAFAELGVPTTVIAGAPHLVLQTHPQACLPELLA